MIGFAIEFEQLAIHLRARFPEHFIQADEHRISEDIASIFRYED